MAKSLFEGHRGQTGLLYPVKKILRIKVFHKNFHDSHNFANSSNKSGTYSSHHTEDLREENDPSSFQNVR